MADDNATPADDESRSPPGSPGDGNSSWRAFSGESHDRPLPGAVGPALGAEGLAPGRPRTPRRPQGGGFLGQLIGVVGGGILGVAIGYYLLNWWGGPQFNFLDLPLPGLPVDQPVADAPRDAAPPPELPEPDGAAAAPVAPAAPDANGPAMPAEPEADTSPPLPADYVGPRTFTSRPIAELESVLLAAKGLVICDRCQSTGLVTVKDAATGSSSQRVPCDQCGGQTGAPLSPQGFATVCQLAELVAFAEPEPNEAVNIRRKDALRAILARATKSDEQRAAIGREAGARLETPQVAGEGILLAGTLDAVGREGRLHWGRVILPGSARPVMIVSRTGLPGKPGDDLGVLGVVVDRPREELVGYAGDEPRVIWVGLATRL